MTANGSDAIGRVILLGCGEQAAVVAESARLAGWVVLGAVNDDPNDVDEAALAAIGLERLGHINDLDRLLVDLEAGEASCAGPVHLHPAAGAGEVRRHWMRQFPDRPFATIVHPDATVAPSAALEAGVWVGPRSVVHSRAHVQQGVIINSGAIVEHDVAVGAWSHIAPNATITGTAAIGSGTMVGAAATVLPGVTVGNGATIGAGSVVTGDVPGGVVARGVPAAWDPAATPA